MVVKPQIAEVTRFLRVAVGPMLGMPAEIQHGLLVYSSALQYTLALLQKHPWCVSRVFGARSFYL